MSTSLDKAKFTMLRSGSTRLFPMPKKTKKEKLMAEKRRPTYEYKNPHVTETSIQKTDDMIELTAIKTDLVKTLILASIAIGIELTIYWLLHMK
jgi:hypothetical protein